MARIGYITRYLTTRGVILQHILPAIAFTMGKDL